MVLTNSGKMDDTDNESTLRKKMIQIKKISKFNQGMKRQY
jgi:hypothetical protein